MPADGNKAEAGFRGPDGRLVKLTVREVAGWVVARYEVPAGTLVWEVVLAQATPGGGPPKVSANQEANGVAVEYGRYAVRDNAACALRVVRQRKVAGLPPWPAAKPDTNTRRMGQTPGLHLRWGADWLWATAGPFGADWEADTADKADVCLRLDHTKQDGGTSGSGGVASVIGGVYAADHGTTHCTDDGEVFVARYRPFKPVPPPDPGRR